MYLHDTFIKDTHPFRFHCQYYQKKISQPFPYIRLAYIIYVYNMAGRHPGCVRSYPSLLRSGSGSAPRVIIPFSCPASEIDRLDSRAFPRRSCLEQFFAAFRSSFSISLCDFSTALRCSLASFWIAFALARCASAQALAASRGFNDGAEEEEGVVVALRVRPGDSV